MNIDRAKAITTGFMSDPELEWLAEQASQHKVIAEVGSWTGRSTRALVDNTPGIVYAVDTWEGSTNGDLCDVLAANGKWWALKEFMKNVGDANNLNIVQMSSRFAAWFIARHNFDMVFIDASHDYLSVCGDIKSWLPLLAPGGLLCGHDYTTERWPDVKRAVDELFPNVQTMQPNTGERSIWWTIK